MGMHFLSVTADALNPDVIQRDQINDLISQLYEAESRANKQEGLKEKFERVRPLPQTRRAVNSLLCRKSGSFGKTSRKRYGRKRKLLSQSDHFGGALAPQPIRIVQSIQLS